MAKAPEHRAFCGLLFASQHRNLVIFGRGRRRNQVVGDHDAGGHTAAAVDLHDRGGGVLDRGLNLV